MATASQVVQGIAEITGVPVTTVVQVDRVLTAAGLRTVGGRGRGAPAVTPRDAAAMLLATIGSSTVKDSGRPVQRHGRMMSFEGEWKSENPLGVAQLDELPADHTFHDAIEALLTAAMTGALGEQDDITELTITITIFEPMTRSEITITDGEHEVTRTYAKARKVGKGNLSFDPPLDVQMHGDLYHRHTITNRTIVHIGLLLGATK